MRILHVNTERTWRGGEQQVLYLTAGLRARGHESTVACLAGSAIAQRLELDGLPSEPLKLRGEWNPAAAWRLSRLVRRLSPDLVHAHTPHAHTLAALAVRLAGRPRRPLVVTRRVDFSIRRHAGFLKGWKYGRAADRIVAISEAIRRVLVSDGVAADRISVVPSGIDPARLAGANPSGLRAEFGIPDSGLVVGTVAHCADHKDHATLAAAIPLGLAREPRAIFLLVGD
ncbi:MAG: glycosyltransferase, partial [Planctomycetota bacterium]